jgi:hypothetical protein
MQPQRNPIRSHFLIGLAAAAALAVGCARLPSQPVVESTGTTLRAPASESALLGGITDLLKGLLVRVLNVVGSVGGTLTNGRWKVAIPAGAIEGNATVAIGVVDAKSLTCQLEILPAEKNRFRTPVTLTMDCSNVSGDLSTYAMFWYDPAKKEWVPVPGCKVDPVKKTCSAPLSHFSLYKVGPLKGKAGW